MFWRGAGGVTTGGWTMMTCGGGVGFVCPMAGQMPNVAAPVTRAAAAMARRT